MIKRDISLLDLTQLESDYWYVKSQIPLFEKQIASAENNLNVLLGKNPGIVETGIIKDSVIVPAVPEGLPSELLLRRPDIRYAEQILISANANIGAVKALYYPAISLSGKLGVASNDLTNLFDPLSQIWNLGANIFVPLFNAGKIKSKVEVAALPGHSLAPPPVSCDLVGQARRRHTGASRRGAISGQPGNRGIAEVLARGPVSRAL